MNAQTALLIIDAQYGLLSGDPPVYHSQQVISNLNVAIAQARLNKMPIIFVQHNGHVGSLLEPNSENWQIHPDLNRIATDYVIQKTVGDCFYEPSLHELLQQLHVKKLWLGGCATDFCVDTGVRTALSHDYGVIVIANGHTCRDRPTLTGEEIVRHFNWVWREMSEAPQRLEVVLAKDLTDSDVFKN